MRCLRDESAVMISRHFMGTQSYHDITWLNPNLGVECHCMIVLFCVLL